jgi:hypothetical protein
MPKYQQRYQADKLRDAVRKDRYRRATRATAKARLQADQPFTVG